MSILDTIVSDKQDVKNQLGDIPDVIPVVKVFEHLIEPRHVATKVVKRTYDGSVNVFILNSSTYGRLGTNKLGNSASTDTLHAVVPPNDLFVEYFGQSLFIDSGSSTGSLDTTNETYTLTTGQILQSTVVYKNNVAINTVKILDHDDIDTTDSTMILGSLSLGTSIFGDTANLYVSNDSGATWNATQIGEIYTFASSATSNELKYKIVAGDTVTILAPLYVYINA